MAFIFCILEYMTMRHLLPKFGPDRTGQTRVADGRASALWNSISALSLTRFVLIPPNFVIALLFHMFTGIPKMVDRCLIRCVHQKPLKIAKQCKKHHINDIRMCLLFKIEYEYEFCLFSKSLL